MAVRIILEGQQAPRAQVDLGYEKKNKELKDQINSYPVTINREVFKKTAKEKELLNKVRRQYKNNNK